MQPVEGAVVCAGSFMLPEDATNSVGAGQWYKLVRDGVPTANVVVFAQIEQKYIFTGYVL